MLRGEEEAAGADLLQGTARRPLSPLLRGVQAEGRWRLRPASGPGRFFQQSAIPSSCRDWNRRAGQESAGISSPVLFEMQRKNVSVLDAADGLAAKQRTDRRPLGKPLGNLLSCPRDRSASASVNFAFALLKAVRKGPSPAPRTCQEPAAERSQVRQPPEDVEVVAWTRPRSPPSRSAALSCCFCSECQPFAVQPKLFSSWGLAPPLTDAAHASPKRNQSAPGLSPPWES